MADINFPKNEEIILAFWEREKIFDQTLTQAAPKGEYVFYEGPPTANGRPGVHHVLARAFKDAILRYKTMQGYRVQRKAGWDTHGLPVELAVEKKLSISGKPQIETLKGNIRDSIVFFNEQCRESVWEFKDLWEKLTARMGYWVDMKHPYVTYENEYINSVWSVVKKISLTPKAGQRVLYQDFRVTPYCYSCGTGLSSHEVAQGYKDVYDTAATVAFTILEDKGELKAGDKILVWTTTPWTLPGNVALAVGPAITYIRITGTDGVNYILAKDLFEANKIKLESLMTLGMGEAQQEFSGVEMIGVKYQPLFEVNDINFSDTAYKIYGADFVTTSDGTGVVHIAPMYGEDDFVLGQNHQLPKIHTVGNDGAFVSTKHLLSDQAFKNLIGLKAKSKEAEKIILERLTLNGSLAATDTYKHSYPHCWRCSTPLLYYAMPSWFIRMSAFREELQQLNEQVAWHPEHIKGGRFGEWITNVKDWAISRSRYWGTPLPIWINEQDETDFQVWTREDLLELGVAAEKLTDLHRPFLDDIRVEYKGKNYRRVPEVLDVWFDSGAMPWAQAGLNALDQTTPEQYPAGFIAEAIDQTRGWFYTLMAIAALTGQKKSPYQNVICLGHINDAKGQKMSKSKGNIVEPFKLFDTYGADAVRWHLFTVNAPGESKNFDEKNVRQVITGVFLTLYNTLTFWELYAEGPFFDLSSVPQETKKNTFDLWQLANVQNKVNQVTEKMDAYDLYGACIEVEKLIDETSTWYLRRNRDRIKDGDLSALSTLGFSLKTISELLAPMAPFLAETIYQRVTKSSSSVHLATWQEIKTLTAEQQAVLIDMQMIRDIIAAGLARRAEAGIKVRQPLSAVTISGVIPNEKMWSIIQEELNVKTVNLSAVEPKGVLSVSLNLEITPELKREGLERELIRTINAERKNQKLQITDLLPALFSTESKDLSEILLSGIINSKVLVTDWKQAVDLPRAAELEVNGEKIKISFKLEK